MPSCMSALARTRAMDWLVATIASMGPTGMICATKPFQRAHHQRCVLQKLLGHFDGCHLMLAVRHDAVDEADIVGAAGAGLSIRAASFPWPGDAAFG